MGIAQSVQRIPVEAKLSAPVQTDSGVRPASCKMGTGSFPGVKWPACGAVRQGWRKSRAIPHLPLWTLRYVIRWYEPSCFIVFYLESVITNCLAGRPVAQLFWGIAPHDGRSLVRFPVGSLDVFKWPNPSLRNPQPWSPLSLLTEMSTKKFP